MNESYLNSVRNTVLSSKPSSAIRLLLIVLLLYITPIISYGQTSSYTIAGTYTFTVPAGVTSITIQAWGAGGAGGWDTNGNARGGGGGGAFSGGTIAVTPGSTITVVVGKGGIADSGTGTNANGNSSSAGGVVANGGGKGWYGASSGAVAASGGAVSSSPGGSVTSFTSFAGGKGGFANGVGYGGGGGGGSAYTNTFGGNGGAGLSNGTGGAGGTGTGAGGAGVNNSDPATTIHKGNNPGGGGGGKGDLNSQLSGNGGDGKVIISYCNPPTAIGVSICATGTGSLTASGSCGSSSPVTVGPSDAGSGSTSGGTGSSWGNLARVTSDDDLYTNTQITNTSSEDLLAINYGFSIPANATINGVQVIIGRKAERLNSLSDSKVYLRIGGIATGTNKASVTKWTTSETVANYGSTIDLWGATLTPAIINAADFGVVLDVDNSNSGDTVAYVDYIQISVTYTIPGSLDWYTASSGGTKIGSGVSFNPVGVAGSGLTNTNTAGTTPYYVECSLSPGCRAEADFVINPTTAISSQSTATQTQCLGSSFTPITVTAAGVGLSYQWYSNASNSNSGGTSLVATNGVQTSSYTPQSTVAGTLYYYCVVTGTCGNVTSAVSGAFITNPILTASVAIAASPSGAICLGTNVTFTATPTNGGTTPTYQWYNGATAIGGATSSTYTTTTLSNGDVIKVVMTSNATPCLTGSPATSNTITATVNTTPTITPNKIDEICPASNNGSISPTLSGGLTNVRYIKLTQKYASWQQVQEIQAFQIFTGTNVALASNGAMATSSSNYSNDATNYGPQKAIDGDYTGYSFWHSNSTNINEWIKVDLQAAKNIDYIKIYNRTDCCQDRGQNMLLELFDQSNNLVYSKTIDLYQSGANVPVNVNVLDVSWADGVTTLNRTGLDSGTYTLNYADAVGCSASSPIVIGAANTAPSAPTVGTTTQPDCTISTGSVVLSGLSGSGTINQTGTATATYTITGTTKTISGLAAGTYNFTVTNATGCTSSPTGNVVINAAITNTWNGVAWDNGTPSSTQALVFSGTYPPAIDLNGDITGCSCTVSNGVNVTIKSGRNLIITNEVTVSGTGTLTFDNTSSLVQTNNVANSGNITYKRTTSTVRKSDYTYWSSPVANQNLSISPSYLLGMFYSYNDFAILEDWKAETASTVMMAGKGYIIRGPQIIGLPPAPGFYDAAFVGVPNNGNIPIAIGPTGTSNLLGNPYASAIDADAFLFTNSSIIEGTIYFWTHNTAIQIASNITNGTAGSGALAYTSDDYASYNITGGVGTGTGNYENGIVKVINTPTGKIAAGQAFFTTSKTTGGTVTFNNAMRISGTTLFDLTGVNQQFFKTKNPKEKNATTIEKNRVWLNMSNTEGAFKQILIGYITGATNDYDSSFDGETFDSNEFLDFYSINQNKNLVIQGRALPFDENDQVPLGYRTTIDGAFTIIIDHTDGVLTNQPIFIEDKLTNTIFDLKTGNYTFNTVAGTFNDRFVLRYTNKALGTKTFNSNEKTVLVSVKNKQIKISSDSETIEKVMVYDLLGKLIYKKEKVSSQEVLISNLTIKNQMLIIKTTLENGITVSDKIVY